MLEIALPLIEMLAGMLPGIAAGVVPTSPLVAILAQIVPIAIAQAPAVIADVRNIIAAVSSSPTITSEQLAALKALDASADADFDSAAAAAGEPNQQP